MTRVLLCNEAAAGSGHVTALASIARALRPECRIQAILPRPEHAEMLAPLCERLDLGPQIRRMPGLSPSRGLSWPNWLYNRGFGDHDVLRRRFTWWREVLSAIRPDLVVAEFAPNALMAARSLGIRSTLAGATYYTPPSSLPRFPDLLTPEAATAHGAPPDPAAPADEDSLCSTINEALVPLGLPQLDRLAALYTADLSLPRGLSLCDPYAEWREAPLILPLPRLPATSDDEGDEIFIYFSGKELKEPAICEALNRLPLPARLVAPHLTSEQVRILSANPRLRIAESKLPPDTIVARSRVILCAGQSGTLGLALLAGVPVLALPMQHEQLSNALRASAQIDTCRMLPRQHRTAARIVDTLAELYHDPALQHRARRHARPLRQSYDQTNIESYRRYLLPLVTS